MPPSGKKGLTIAIDGPAAAGKSTVARAVAARLGLTYVDTGAMYRALTLKALESGVDPQDGPALGRLARGTSIELGPSRGSGGQRVRLDGRDVTREIRSREVDRAVSHVSRHPEVREWLSRVQERMAEDAVVMEGRDIGTVVLPHADLKVYLDASFDRRVERRYRELEAKGYSPDLGAVREDMAQRDRLDSTREAAPLAAAEDAVRIDTTDMTLEEVVEEVLRLAGRSAGSRG
ncbi:MAG TPA: (d)CMP kinase [Clostridiales bacterium]|nr:(d)CMP kinase [Clostridiales bacterium]